ncbi:MAG: HesA/MoeB/ThiF family protein [Oscillospiraceae bacterium]|nr:HesA/MoeB/ThiF family protein [Oscillospiraceae bacterium]
MNNERYTRQLLLNEIGEAGQAKLAAGRVLLIGAGGLGSPAALYLAATGVGTIALADSDVVELSNLNRQIVHSTSRIDAPKVDSAAGVLRDLNPEVAVITHHMRVEPDNIAALIADYDFVLDCSDNFATKFMINDACTAAQKPFCHAGVMGFSSQLMTWLPGCTCFRCVFRQPPPGPQNKAVLGVAAGLAGTLQAMEAIKFITGAGELLTNTLLTIDALQGEFHRVTLPRNLQCSACGSIH